MSTPGRPRIKAVDRERLKQLISEELTRALGEAGTPPAPTGGPSPALIVFSGPHPPAEPSASILSTLNAGGRAFQLVLSDTFRSLALPAAGALLAGYPLAANPLDEAAAAALLNRAPWIVFPDLSDNSLTKAVLGLADSIPTRALSGALASGKACLLLETREPPSAAVGLDRLERLRQLERRGAVLARPGNFFEMLEGALAPPEERRFRPVPPRPPERRRIIAGEDVYEASRRGQMRLEVPATAIVTDQAREEARRRGIEIVRSEDAS